MKKSEQKPTFSSVEIFVYLALVAAFLVFALSCNSVKMEKQKAQTGVQR